MPLSRHGLRLFEGVAGAKLLRYGYQLSGYPAELRWTDRLRYETKEISHLCG